LAYQKFDALIRGERNDSVLGPINRVGARRPTPELRHIGHDQLSNLQVPTGDCWVWEMRMAWSGLVSWVDVLRAYGSTFDFFLFLTPVESLDYLRGKWVIQQQLSLFREDCLSDRSRVQSNRPIIDPYLIDSVVADGR
jgi:hypothetical protein